MLDKSNEKPALKVNDKKEPVVVKKYANRRLYNTETSTYVTLDDLAAMVKAERDFVVFDAKSGDDLTHSVLTQIIVEQEARNTTGQTMLPIPFLRQLIRFYGDSVGKMVPSYLQVSLDTLTLKVDNKEVANYLYTEREAEALLKGGVQRVYLGNLKVGNHELVAFFTGKGPHVRDYKRGTSLQFEKGVGAKYLELKVSDKQIKEQPEFIVKEWE